MQVPWRVVSSSYYLRMFILWKHVPLACLIPLIFEKDSKFLVWFIFQMDLSFHHSISMNTSAKEQSTQELFHCDSPLKAVRNKGHLLVARRSKDYLMSSNYWEWFCYTDSPRNSDWWNNQILFVTLHEDYFYPLQLLLFTEVYRLYTV